ncbi:MAG: radical SAM protein [bacterium]
MVSWPLLRRWAGQARAVPHYYLPYLFREGQAGTPLCVDIELTYRCNLKCLMCPQEQFKINRKSRKPKRPELEQSERENILDDLAHMRVGYITFTGGEPFVNPACLPLIRYAKRSGLFCNVLSNGALLTEEKVKEICESGLDSITFSLDGTEAVHDKIRGIPGSYQKLTAAIRNFRLHPGNAPCLGLNCTISALNQDDFSRLVDIAHELGIRAVNFAFLFFTDEEAVEKTKKMIDISQGKEENQIIPDYLKEVDLNILGREIETCFQKARDKKIPINFSPPVQGAFLEKYFFDRNYSYAGKCFFPWYSSRINPYGDVYPCSLDLTMGNIREQPFSQIWNGPDYVNFRKNLKERKLFPKCMKCCELKSRLWDYLPGPV